MVLPKQIVVLSHRTLSLEDLDEHTLSAYIVSVCPFFVGMVVFRSMSFAITPPEVSTLIDKEVTWPWCRCHGTDRDHIMMSSSGRSCTCEDLRQ